MGIKEDGELEENRIYGGTSNYHFSFEEDSGSGVFSMTDSDVPPRSFVVYTQAKYLFDGVQKGLNLGVEQ